MHTPQEVDNREYSALQRQEDGVPKTNTKPKPTRVARCGGPPLNPSTKGQGQVDLYTVRSSNSLSLKQKNPTQPTESTSPPKRVQESDTAELGRELRG